MPSASVHADAEGGIPLSVLLRETGLVASASEARNFIIQGAVRINGELQQDPAFRISAGETHVYQCGKKRFVRCSVTE